VDLERLAIAYLVFAGFALVAFGGDRVWMAGRRNVWLPWTLNERHLAQVRDQGSFARALAGLGAVGSGILAVAVTIQELLGLL
jgi:hypothetical protein